MSDGTRRSDYIYDLPPNCIAQHPAPRRSEARLLLVGRGPVEDGADPADESIAGLPLLLRGDELVVLNDTQVLAARLQGTKPTGGAVELLVTSAADERGRVRALVKTAKRVRPGLVCRVGDSDVVVHGPAPGGDGFLVDLGPEAAGARLHDFLRERGSLPLPPYIRRPEGSSEADAVRYQTVFAAVPGAVAAPTAGLHFTNEMLASIASRGCELAYVTLHVGPGTFQPMRAESLADHHMHAEEYEISEQTADAVARARRDGRPVLAVGTTVVRALEGSAALHGQPRAERRTTDIFIRPPFEFRVVDQLLTNFHLPGSTLLALVSAFAGRARVLAAYAEAVERGYRFYSYGDAMLLR